MGGSGTLYHKKKYQKAEKEKISEEDLEFYEYVKDIVFHPAVLEMKEYPHHCSTDCYQHSLNVAYYTYRICRKFHLDAKSAARAGMLHDLFLYDWRLHTDETGDHFHAMTHPKAALKNAQRNFCLNPLEREMILKHMWPVTIVPPTHWETFFITLADKYCGSFEIGSYYSSKKLPRRTFYFFKKVLKKVFGPDFMFHDYHLPYGSEVEAASGVVFTRFRNAPSSSWKRGAKGRRRPK